MVIAHRLSTIKTAHQILVLDRCLSLTAFHCLLVSLPFLDIAVPFLDHSLSSSWAVGGSSPAARTPR